MKLKHGLVKSGIYEAFNNKFLVLMTAGNIHNIYVLGNDYEGEFPSSQIEAGFVPREYPLIYSGFTCRGGLKLPEEKVHHDKDRTVNLLRHYFNVLDERLFEEEQAIDVRNLDKFNKILDGVE